MLYYKLTIVDIGKDQIPVEKQSTVAFVPATGSTSQDSVTIASMIKTAMQVNNELMNITVAEGDLKRVACDELRKVIEDMRNDPSVMAHRLLTSSKETIIITKDKK